MTNPVKSFGENLIKLGEKLVGEANTELTKEEKENTHNVKLAEGVTEEGVRVYSEDESWKVGSEVFVEIDGERVLAPIGEHVLADGSVLVVEVEGIISEYRETEEVKEDVEVEVEEKVEQEKEAVNPKSVIDRTEREIKFENEVESLKAEISELKSNTEALTESVTNTLSELTKNITELAAPADSITLNAEIKETVKKEPVDLSAMNTQEKIHFYNKQFNTFK
tara:strand:- start:1096 stop:1764 length:669 start_codon:yes stop_codon:yes gene_type:complete